MATILPISNEGQDAEEKPADIDPGGLLDVLEQQLGEYRPDGERSDDRQDRDARAAKRNVEGHLVGAVQLRLDEPQPHDSKVRSGEGKGRRQRVDGSEQVDLGGEDKDRAHDPEDDDRDVRGLEFWMQLREGLRKEVVLSQRVAEPRDAD